MMKDDGFETVIEIKDLDVNVLSERLGVAQGYGSSLNGVRSGRT